MKKLFPAFIIRAVSKLAEGAFEIGRGKLDTTIELKGTDELGRLGDIFNVMTGNLKKAQENMLEKQRMETELKTAEEIQATLLPETLPEIKGLEFGAYYSAQSESGGDYYDFIDLENNKLGIAMADVSGHGVGSGLVMAMTRTLLHAYCKEVSSTKKIFETINHYLKKNTASNFFVTMFYGIFDIKTKKLKYSSAGHCQTIILRNKSIVELPGGGIALGATGNEIFSKNTDITETPLEKGDCLIQYTDGIDEAMDKDSNEFGLDRFHDAIKETSGKNPQQTIEHIIKKLNAFTGNIPQHDDITLIVMKIN